MDYTGEILFAGMHPVSEHFILLCRYLQISADARFIRLELK